MPNALDEIREDVRERLNELADLMYEGNAARFARAAGYDRVKLHRILTGKTKKIDLDLIQSVTKNVTDVHGSPVSAGWLESGRGPMFAGASPAQPLATRQEEGAVGGQGVLVLPDAKEYFRLTVYHSVRPGAGNGRIIYSVDEADAQERIQHRQIFHDLLGFWPPETMRAVYVDGHSMEPGIRHGQLVLYEPVDHMVSGQRYVMLIEDPQTGDWPLYIKRVQMFAGGGLKIISDNRALGLEDEILVPDGEGHLIHQQTGLRVRLRVVGLVLWPNDEDAERVKTITRTIEQLSSMGLTLSR